jgi:hypothetical protein
MLKPQEPTDTWAKLQPKPSIRRRRPCCSSRTHFRRALTALVLCGPSFPRLFRPRLRPLRQARMDPGLFRPRLWPLRRARIGTSPAFELWLGPGARLLGASRPARAVACARASAALCLAALQRCPLLLGASRPARAVACAWVSAALCLAALQRFALSLWASCHSRAVACACVFAALCLAALQRFALSLGASRPARAVACACVFAALCLAALQCFTLLLGAARPHARLHARVSSPPGAWRSGHPVHQHDRRCPPALKTLAPVRTSWWKGSWLSVVDHTNSQRRTRYNCRLAARPCPAEGGGARSSQVQVASGAGRARVTSRRAATVTACTEEVVHVSVRDVHAVQGSRHRRLDKPRAA